MSLMSDFIRIMRTIDDAIEIPRIKEVFFPKKLQNSNSKIQRASNFGAIRLEDGSIGIIFINLSEKVRRRAASYDSRSLIGRNPLDVVENFSEDLFKRMLSLGAINAISQYIFKASGFNLDFTTNSLGLLDLNAEDKVGMVGFFPPLVKKIEKLGIPLIIIEKKEQFIKQTKNWEVTMDPKKLKGCTKILSTSTTVINNTVDEILHYSKNASKISFIGPTGGFLPDPLFLKGVDVIGGTYVEDSSLFMNLIKQNKKWGPSTRKYCIKKEEYRNFQSLLETIVDR
jgi:uncharacterized protein (DUF4213/DUF364 family)